MINTMDIRLSISVSPPRVMSPASPQPAEQLVAQATVQPPVQPNTMPLPPEAGYNSKEELYASIQAWAAQYNYAFRIERSTKINKGSRTRILFSCDRSGSIPPANHPQNRFQDRKRSTATRKTGCQFSIIALERTDTQWEVRHRPGVVYNVHNHPPSQSISSHPSHRKLPQADLIQAKHLHNAGK